MNRRISARQRGQETRFPSDGETTTSHSQERHWKWIVALMMPLFLILGLSEGLRAQSIAAAARQERERQANSKASHVVSSSASAHQAEEAKTAPSNASTAQQQKDPGKKPANAALDPVQAWNKQVDELRAKVRALQDREVDLLRRQNATTNQVYAPVTDPSTQERAQAELAGIQQELAGVRKDLDETQKKLSAMQAQGPPKR